jgi:hypothetical protein
VRQGLDAEVVTGYPLFEPVYGQEVKGALDYVLVVILGCIIVASLVLVAIVVLKGLPL